MPLQKLTLFGVLSLSGSMLLQCNIALAQQRVNDNLTIEEALQFCAAFEDAAERLLCFEALAESAQAGDGTRFRAELNPNKENKEEESDLAKGVAVAPTPELDQAPRTAAAESDEETVDEETVDEETVDVQPAVTTAQGGVAEGENSQASAEAPRFRIVRSDALEEKRRNRQKHTLTVHRAWRNAVGHLRVAFANGEIWIQSGWGTRHNPKPGDEVVLKPALGGGWTLNMQNGRYAFRGRQLNKNND